MLETYMAKERHNPLADYADEVKTKVSDNKLMLVLPTNDVDIKGNIVTMSKQTALAIAINLLVQVSMIDGTSS